MRIRIAIAIVALAAFSALFLIGRGQCADSSTAPTSPTIEKRLAEVEGKLAALSKKVESLHREEAVCVIALHGISAREAARAVRALFRSRLDVEVTPLRKANLLIVRGDGKAVEEIEQIVRSVETLGKPKQPPAHGATAEESPVHQGQKQEGQKRADDMPKKR